MCGFMESSCPLWVAFRYGNGWVQHHAFEPADPVSAHFHHSLGTIGVGCHGDPGFGGEVQIPELLVAVACRYSDLGSNHRHHAGDLRLSCKPVRIEVIGGPRRVVTHAFEAEAEEMLNLVCRTPSVPAGRLVGAGDGRKPRDGHEAPILIDGAGFSQL